MDYSELKCINYLPDFQIEQFGRDCFIYNRPTEEDVNLARKGLERCRKILKEGITI